MEFQGDAFAATFELPQNPGPGGGGGGGGMARGYWFTGGGGAAGSGSCGREKHTRVFSVGNILKIK